MREETREKIIWHFFRNRVKIVSKQSENYLWAHFLLCQDYPRAYVFVKFNLTLRLLLLAIALHIRGIKRVANSRIKPKLSTCLNVKLSRISNLFIFCLVILLSMSLNFKYWSRSTSNSLDSAKSASEASQKMAATKNRESSGWSRSFLYLWKII